MKQINTKTTAKAFTIIELLITVAIMGILATIAYPSYINSLQKGRRSDALSALGNGAAKQELLSLKEGVYTGTATTLWSGGKSANGYYIMTISELNTVACGGDPCFELTATATGTQANDTSCPTFVLDSQENQTANTGCWPQ